MSNYWKLYLLTRLEGVQFVLIMAIVAGLALFIFSMLGAFEDSEAGTKYYRRLAIWVLAVTVPLLVFIPSGKQAMLIIAGGAALNFVEADTTLQKTPHKAAEIITTYMDKKMEELKSE